MFDIIDDSLSEMPPMASEYPLSHGDREQSSRAQWSRAQVLGANLPEFTSHFHHRLAV